MMHEWYILVGTRPVLEPDHLKAARWMESHDRTVAKTQIEGALVSTVFLGLDHNYGTGGPILFETMVFGPPCDMEMQRYRTWEEAEAGHAEMVKYVKGLLDRKEGE